MKYILKTEIECGKLHCFSSRINKLCSFVVSNARGQCICSACNIILKEDEQRRLLRTSTCLEGKRTETMGPEIYIGVSEKY
jgi:hypothetical protein